MTASRIYIDSCCFIEYAKGKVEITSAFTEKDIDLIKTILQAGKNRHVHIVTSVLTIAECLHAGDSNNVPNEVKRLFKSVLTSGKIVKLKATDVFVAECARDLRWKSGINLKPIDSIHLSSAIETECKEFWTCDRFNCADGEKIKRIEESYGIKIVRPSETKLLPEDYKQKQLFDTGQQLSTDRKKPARQKSKGLQGVSEIISESLQQAAKSLKEDAACEGFHLEPKSKK